MNRYDITSKDGSPPDCLEYEGGEWVLYDDVIEYLRKHLLAVCEERRLAEQEWKRRSFLLWDWMATNFQPWLLEDHPEAKDWFEEKA